MATLLKKVERDWKEIGGKLVAGLGGSVSVTAVVEALKYLGITNYPSWVPALVAIAAYFVFGYLKADYVKVADTGTVGELEGAAEAVGDDLSDGDIEKAVQDAFAALAGS